jgi:hypothetical protein
LAAVPTSAAVRRERRLVLLVPAGLAVWLAYLSTGQTPVPDLGWPVAPVIALISAGVAVAVWAPPAAGIVAGVALPIAWASAVPPTGGLGEGVSEVLFAWHHHPWIVTVVAVAALLVGRNR